MAFILTVVFLLMTLITKFHVSCEYRHRPYYRRLSTANSVLAELVEDQDNFSDYMQPVADHSSTNNHHMKPDDLNVMINTNSTNTTSSLSDREFVQHLSCHAEKHFTNKTEDERAEEWWTSFYEYLQHKYMSIYFLLISLLGLLVNFFVIFIY